MNRRKFLKRFGLGTVGALLITKVVIDLSEKECLTGTWQNFGPGHKLNDDRLIYPLTPDECYYSKSDLIYDENLSYLGKEWELSEDTSNLIRNGSWQEEIDFIRINPKAKSEITILTINKDSIIC